jgi:hypothetical protein
MVLSVAQIRFRCRRKEDSEGLAYVLVRMKMEPEHPVVEEVCFKTGQAALLALGMV